MAHARRARRAPVVLLIEDDPDFSALARELLEGEGYRVVTTASATEGVRMARRLLPDVISLDLGLPGRSGLQVLDELRSHPATWEIPIVVCTAYELDVLEHPPRLPRECFFTKPLELRRYLDALARLVSL